MDFQIFMKLSDWHGKSRFGMDRYEWIRKITLDHLDRKYDSSVAALYAGYALGMKYEMLPKNVIHAAKRCLLDAVGCMIGAFSSDGYPIMEGSALEWGGKKEASILGSGKRTSAGNAALVNTFLVHYLGYNDLGGGGHNSDTIPSILAVAEKEGADGKDFLMSVIISYELGARISEAAGGFTAYEAKGFPFDIRGGISLPPCIGRLMKLNEHQIANAIGICASHSIPLGVLDTNREEHFHAKNLRMGFVARDAVEACILAKNGLTGPVRVIEGDHGFRQVLLNNELDLDVMTDWSGFRILDVRYKNMCLNSTTMGHVQTTLKIVTEHDLWPEDILSVEIGTGIREYCHTASLEKKYPRNAETADHSAFYANAMAIRDHKCRTNLMEKENFTDPVILELIDKISIYPHEELGEWSSGAIVKIVTKDGRIFNGQCEEPYGLGKTIMSDEELEEKFREMAGTYFSEKETSGLIDLIWHAEEWDSVDILTKQLAVPERLKQTNEPGGKRKCH